MTNSRQDVLSTITGTPDQTSQDDAEFVSDKGTEFSIKTRPNGLFYISMLRGGNKPPVCDELFTRRRFAEAALIKYLKSTDRLGGAQYPGKRKKKIDES